MNSYDTTIWHLMMQMQRDWRPGIFRRGPRWARKASRAEPSDRSIGKSAEFRRKHHAFGCPCKPSHWESWSAFFVLFSMWVPHSYMASLGSQWSNAAFSRRQVMRLGIASFGWLWLRRLNLLLPFCKKSSIGVNLGWVGLWWFVGSWIWVWFWFG